VLVLAHDWCGDVVANLPLFGKIERETNKLRLHILLRDPDNQDIAAAYLHADGHNHIPTYVFFNQQGEELGVFIERPAEITTLMSGWVADFYTANPQFEGRGVPIGQLATPVKEALLTYLKLKRQEVRLQEQTAILGFIQQIATRISAVVGH